MTTRATRVGIISCSGEEVPEGTISRVACRRVLEDLQAGKSVTICLPLFIAGGEEERKFAARFPTITVDGCEKRCAAKATEKFSAKPAKSLVVPEILKRRGLSRPTNVRHLGKEEKAAAEAVAEEIAQAVDEVLEKP
jgi:uncharacterized metal-binding protein